MPGRLRLRQLEKELAPGATRAWALSRPLGLASWSQDSSRGCRRSGTGKGMGEDTPERTGSAAGWHELQTYKQTVLARRSWPRVFDI